MARVWLPVLVVMTAWSAAGCSRRPPATLVDVRAAAEREAHEAVDHADGLVLAGCYDCLLQAREAYQAMATSPLATLVSERLFEVQLLIVLREQELALPTTASLDRLRELATPLPETFDTSRILALVEGLPPLPDGVPQGTLAALGQVRAPGLRAVAAAPEWLESVPLWAPVRDYLRVSLACAPTVWPAARAPEAAPPAGATPDDSVLLLFRRATCDATRDMVVLDGLRSDQRFAEAAFFVARASLGQSREAGTARTRASALAAYTRFPASPAVTYVRGTVDQVAGNCEAALRYYDETLALAPGHENAQLGRTMCLTALARADEAIAAASTLIGWRTGNQRDAYYWRAFNERSLQRLDDARRDIEASKRRGQNVENLTLAGVIQFDQHEMDGAERDLTLAWSASNETACLAAWYEGLVLADRQRWPDVGRWFQRGATCYEASAALDRAALAELDGRTDLEPEFQTTQRQRLRLAIEDDQRQQRASALNAASGFANAGDLVQARVFLRMAATDPALADAASKLEGILRALEAQPSPAARR